MVDPLNNNKIQLIVASWLFSDLRSRWCVLHCSAAPWCSGAEGREIKIKTDLLTLELTPVFEKTRHLFNLSVALMAQKCQ